jgi:hypothetical protein
MRLPGSRGRLQRQGEKAAGVLIDTGTLHGTLLVRYPDGSENEVRIGNPFGDNTDGRWRVGQKLPVRYDPNDPTSVVVDKAALKGALKQTTQRIEEQARAEAISALRGEKNDDDGVPDLDPAVAESDPELAELVEQEKRERDKEK